MNRIMAATICSTAGGLCIAARHAYADVPVALAIDAAQAAIATCKANGYNVTVTVMDADLSTRVVLRGDGAPDMTVEIGRRKAYTAVKTGMSSADFGKTVPGTSTHAGPPLPGPPKLPGPVNGDPNLITWAGGLPIKAAGQIIGSMSVSGAPGGEKDEACVNAGLAKIADKLK